LAAAASSRFSGRIPGRGRLIEGQKRRSSDQIKASPRVAARPAKTAGTWQINLIRELTDMMSRRFVRATERVLPAFVRAFNGNTAWG
jgi:hypothetical protein